eukprot:CAMPEP_0168460020 /NCGR_PEP_ID=MMETSP0228-20121227/53225_1 /TAXON_ID=133427 /ORGANISM="Protoceratium reticulatum, Strain CCCM 535 (=CCMP 1889)" /LENGTH=456 /DNA_ID=CAMNT_0008475233 /DNA_START=118 /DNA_END=1485 /DNA_ORIENTATION=-
MSVHLRDRPQRVLYSLRPEGLMPESEPTPVAAHGKLRVQGNQILDQAGQPVRLRGMSLFWSQWGDQFYTPETVQWLAKDWKADVVRAAMGIESDGYLTYPEFERDKVETVVKAAILAGIYVIIDWHDHNAEMHIPEAQQFFGEMARKYGSHPNVLFELFAEPELQKWSSTIKPAHEAVIPLIRNHTDNLIILGTQRWSQDVDEASVDPVAGENLAYSLHFNAATHGEWLRDKVVAALDAGIPIFSTQWVVGQNVESGVLEFAEAEKWIGFLGARGISDVGWSVSGQKGASRRAAGPAPSSRARAAGSAPRSGASRRPRRPAPRARPRARTAGPRAAAATRASAASRRTSTLAPAWTPARPASTCATLLSFRRAGRAGRWAGDAFPRARMQERTANSHSVARTRARGASRRTSTFLAASTRACLASTRMMLKNSELTGAAGSATPRRCRRPAREPPG